MRVGLLLSLAPLAAAVDPDMVPERMRGGEMYANLLRARDEAASSLRDGPLGWSGPNTTANWKTSLLDNFAGPSAGTYQQRFFIDLSFCAPTTSCATTAPILLLTGGEWTVSSSPSNSVITLAQQLGSAVLVYLEHRFYGASWPGDRADRTLMQQYLTVEQAVEDIAAFIPYFNGFIGSPDAKRQWVIIGGSYAGALVAWFTVRHGDMLAATWSSSGVVNAIFNFTAFDQTVATALGPACSDAARAVTSAFEAAWAVNYTGLHALFGVTPGYYTQQDFAWMIADSQAQAPQYGNKDKLCSAIMPGGAALAGWDALVAFANFTIVNYGPGFAVDCYYSTACLSDSSYSAQWSDGTTWVWQCCSELAYWQIAYPGSIRSQMLNSSYFMGQCQAAFGATVFPDTVSFNQRFGGATPFVNASSNVFATQGSDDPWQPAGVNAPISDNYLESTAQCDGCSHCKDLRMPTSFDSPQTTQQRAMVMSQIATWLQPSVAPSNAPGPLPLPAVIGIVVGVVGVVFALLAFRYRHKLRCRSSEQTYSSLPSYA